MTRARHDGQDGERERRGCQHAKEVGPTEDPGVKLGAEGNSVSNVSLKAGDPVCA